MHQGCLEILERKQGRTYLADQTRFTKVELGHMAGFVAAGDACPAAAVMAPFLPRGEEAVGVVDDALLEGQQRVPLVRPAARMGGDEEAAGYGGNGKEQDEPGD
jgi:hypothetical protein